MTTASPRRSVPWLLQAPQVGDVHAPKWFDRQPRWLSTGGVLVVLLAISAFIRTRYIGGEFWSDEAIAVGVASHPLGAIPGILRHEGSTPLYYFVLHIWISVFGSGESATHALSLLLGLVTVPLGMWSGWSLAGRRAGMLAAALFALSAFLTEYAQETQAYELVALIGLIATVSFLHAFVFRRRRFVIPFAISLVLMLYTSFWAILFWGGAVIALVPIYRAAHDRRGILRDAGASFAAAAVLFAPWVPNLVYQMAHTTSPWGYADFVGATFPSDLLGSDRVVVALAVAAAVSLLPMLSRARRRTPEATMMWALIALPLAAVLLARVGSILSPTWVTRYFATLVAPVLLLAAFTAARAGIIGLIAVGLTLVFLANPASFSPQHKSDMRDVAGELAPYMRPGDVVLVGMPEQSPLAWYYLPAGLRFATTMGPVKDPSYMNWVNAYTRLKDASPQIEFTSLVASLKPGQRLLYTRPLTEGAKAWNARWSRLVRRRAAQWGALIAADPQLKPIAGAVAPHNYRSACCVADNAIVYSKVG
jgi:mannosyltransferase